MKFVTVTGSLYELDLTGRKIRRLEGKGSPTPRQGKDGEWKDYVAVSIPCVGSPLLVTWRVDAEDGTTWFRMTATSKILSIDEVTEEDNIHLTQMALSLGESKEMIA